MKRHRVPATKMKFCSSKQGDYPLARCEACNLKYKGKITDVTTGNIKIINCIDNCFFLKIMGR